MGQKYYAVKVGRTPGIYMTWSETQAQVNKFPNAIFKSFPTLEEAHEFMGIKIDKFHQKPTKSKPVKHSLTTMLNTDLDNPEIDPRKNANQIISKISITQLNPDSIICSDILDKYTPDTWIYHLGEYFLFTDGSFNTKSLASSWAVYLGQQGGLIKKMPDNTTNNKCELLAILAVINCIETHLGPLLLLADKPPGVVINIVTDSELCVNIFTKWIENWRKNNWKLAGGGDPKNLDEILAIDKLLAEIAEFADTRGKRITVQFLHQKSHTLPKKFNSQREHILWEGNYVVDYLAQLR